MSVIEAPADRGEVDAAQLLFEEARQRRRRRWLISGIVVLAGLLLVGTIVTVTSWRGDHASVAPATAPPVMNAASPSAGAFSVRPLLCFASAATPGVGASAVSAPLPVCAAASALTVSNLEITPTPSNVVGYTSNLDRVPVDPQFAAYPSTDTAHDAAGATVLLPGTTGAPGSVRYVLGPAGLTGSDVRSAKAQLVSGEWTVDLHLTGSGATRWDALAQRQFHALVGVVVDNKVISAPVTQPTQATFSTFAGQLQIAGGLTEHQARSLASSL